MWKSDSRHSHRSCRPEQEYAEEKIGQNSPSTGIGQVAHFKIKHLNSGVLCSKTITRRNERDCLSSLRDWGAKLASARRS